MLKEQWLALWKEHIDWTRRVILAVLNGAPAGTQAATIATLLKNADAMGDALEPHGVAFADEMRRLLREHLTIAVDVLHAALWAQQSPSVPARAALNTAVAAWRRNGERLAEAMALESPAAWPLEGGLRLWAHHLSATLEEAVAHLAKNWPREFVAWERVRLGALEMAGWISDGLAEREN